MVRGTQKNTKYISKHCSDWPFNRINPIPNDCRISIYPGVSCQGMPNFLTTTGTLFNNICHTFQQYLSHFSTISVTLFNNICHTFQHYLSQFSTISVTLLHNSSKKCAQFVYMQFFSTSSDQGN